MLSRSVRQRSRRILEAVSLKTRRGGMPPRRSSFRPSLEALEARSLPSVNPIIGDVFYIEMENHNLTQPSSVTSPQQLLGYLISASDAYPTRIKPSAAGTPPRTPAPGSRTRWP